MSECVHPKPFTCCVVYTVSGCFARHVHRFMSDCVCVRACVCVCVCVCVYVRASSLLASTPFVAVSPPPIDSLALLTSARTHILSRDTCIIPSPSNPHMICLPLRRGAKHPEPVASSHEASFINLERNRGVEEEPGPGALIIQGELNKQ